MHGTGILIDSEKGEEYEGEFVDDVKHGFG